MYSYVRASWADLFGLSTLDLTEEQIKKINTKKLVEFVLADPRVEKIVGDRILENPTVDEVGYVKSISANTFDKLEYLKIKYNECLAIHESDLDSQTSKTYSARRDYVSWEKLSKGNKIREIQRWLNKKSAIINYYDIDFNWLSGNAEWMVSWVADKLTVSNNKDHLTYVTRYIPDKYYPKYLDKILFFNDPGVYSYCLNRSITPDNIKIKILKNIAGRKRIPSLDVAIDSNLFSKLPPVTRLKALETLLVYSNSKVVFSDITSEDGLNELLFVTSLKYNQRVKRVVQIYKSRCLQEKA